jgi:type I restriction enzyme, S subunit
MKLTPIKDIIAEKISGEWGDEAIDGKGVVIIRTANFLNSGKINFSNLVRRKVDPKKVAKKRLLSGDIIIEKSGGSPTQPVGRVVIFQSPDNDTYLCNNFTSILRPKKNEVHSEYLFYVLHNNHKKGKTLRHQNKTTGIINLKLDSYLDSEIPLPTLDDQIRIAHLLGKVEGLIAQRKQHLQQLDELHKSVFLEMFGDPVQNEKRWDTKALPELCIKITDGEHLNPQFSRSGMPMVMAGNVLDHTVSIRDTKFVDYDLGKSFRKKCNPELSDVLLVSRGATIGRLCRVDTSEPFCLMGSVILLKPNHQMVNSTFLVALLKHPALYFKLFKSSGSSAQQAIYLKDVKRLVCILPPEELQSKFSDFSERVESAKEAYRSALTDLESLYNALSQQAFKGELDLSRVGSIQ